MTDDRHVWTVSELTARIKERLEAEFPAFWVEGEIRSEEHTSELQSR